MPAHAPADLAAREAEDAFLRATYRAHDRRVGRLVARFRLEDRRRADLPPGPVPLADLRLEALSYRWGAGACGEPRPRVPLVTYRPEVDLQGSGRVRFLPEHARDLACRHACADGRLVADALRLHRAAELADQNGEWADELALPGILLAYDPAATPGPPPGFDPADWAAVAVAVEGLTAWPQPLLARTVGDEDAPPLEPAPVAAYADLAHLRGHRIPNPVRGPLRDRGLDPERFAAGDRSGWADALHAFLDAEPGREGPLRRDLRDACRAAGLHLPGGPWGEAATRILHEPEPELELPDAPRPQAIRLGGPPGPETARFATAVFQADLGALDGFGARFRTVPRGVVAAVLDDARRGRRR